MSKKTLLATVALLGALATSAIASNAAGEDPVVARVNGEEIRRSEVIRQIGMAGPQVQQLPLEMIFPQFVQKIVTTKVVSQKGYAEGLQNDEAVKQRMKDLEAQLVAEAYVHKIVDPKITESKIKARYNELSAKFKPQDEVRARHILVKKESDAEDLLKQIKGGADFAKLAEEKSEDSGSAKQGGDLGYFVRDAMVKAFADAAFALKKGGVSDKPVKTEFGYHIIKVEDKRKSAPPPMAEVKEQISNQLGQEMTTEEVKAMEAKAKIEMFNIDGSPIDEKDSKGKKGKK